MRNYAEKCLSISPTKNLNLILRADWGFLCITKLKFVYVFALFLHSNSKERFEMKFVREKDVYFVQYKDGTRKQLRDKKYVVKNASEIVYFAQKWQESAVVKSEIFNTESLSEFWHKLGEHIALPRKAQKINMKNISLYGDFLPRCLDLLRDLLPPQFTNDIQYPAPASSECNQTQKADKICQEKIADREPYQEIPKSFRIKVELTQEVFECVDGADSWVRLDENAKKPDSALCPNNIWQQYVFKLENENQRLGELLQESEETIDELRKELKMLKKDVVK